jgi:hypothetical protein
MIFKSIKAGSLLLAELTDRLISEADYGFNLADLGDISASIYRVYLIFDAPSIVNVLPAPVYPYIKTVPLIPSNELRTIALSELFSYTS